jgi:hypothetical protein
MGAAGGSTILDQAESLITATDAARLIPSHRPGRRTNVATVHRWLAAGKLEYVVTPGGRMTSAEAVRRMLERLTSGYCGERPVAAVRTASARERAIARADAALDRMGV